MEENKNQDCNNQDLKFTVLKTIKNPNKETYERITQAVLDNDGYCPCLLVRNDDTKCICSDFKNQAVEGECHCGRFIKVLVED